MNNSVYDSIMQGLMEAVEDAKSAAPSLKRRVVTISPVKEYCAEEIKSIRQETGLSQKLFAGYIGVSPKTVEAWEAGINHPSGAASRILNMMEMDANLITDFPFIKLNSED
jgi:putative transcriptional regulator